MVDAVGNINWQEYQVEYKKLEQYQSLKDELEKMWKKKANMVPKSNRGCDHTGN